MKHTNTGKDRFVSLKASYSALGLTTRVHGNTKHAPKNALKFEEIKNLLSFINNYAEKHAILLPGRIPGYKDNLQLLPSSTTKKVSPLKKQPQCTSQYGSHLSVHTSYCRQCGWSTSCQQMKLI